MPPFGRSIIALLQNFVTLIPVAGLVNCRKRCSVYSRPGADALIFEESFRLYCKFRTNPVVMRIRWYHDISQVADDPFSTVRSHSVGPRVKWTILLEYTAIKVVRRTVLTSKSHCIQHAHQGPTTIQQFYVGPFRTPTIPPIVFLLEFSRDVPTDPAIFSFIALFS